LLSNGFQICLQTCAATPWYNSNSGHFKEGWRAQEALEETLYAAGVDVVLNGHVHAYERSHPVKSWRPDPCGAVHLVVGDGVGRCTSC
jgi:hypothetical protein